ncbi:MAG: PD40 domain-containing protein [Ardenticatenaceae bacterium]|nr:PD40 domain-containing protein [Ardenticatenaceae bacterium]MCB8949613.1 PD40 domain-containing protein [Ardenticatenaceae bacterium]
MSRQFTRIFQFSLLVLGITAVLVFTAHAAPVTQEIPTGRPRFNLEEIPFQAAESDQTAPGESALSVTAPDILLSWSKVAFQSLRNGNWDIYVGNDDGSGQTAVVASGASEIHPHLNRGNTKIVYASNSGGDHEIYVANVDGSGQTALTNNSTDDGNPTWSPDGSKIAFEAYRNGEADIYVMNANGTGQTRLTTSADFDGMPTWSPDGSKIAFVSRRTGGYRIYVMNADGSGQTQLSNQPYSLRPQWSPDGTQIAYDADSDNDGWQDLWRMNADGSSQTLVYNPSGQTDAWASSWSPDGSRIVYTLISFIYYQGNWYWTYAYPEAWNSGGITRLSTNGLDWDAAWQTSDSSSPVLTLNSTPEYSRNPLVLSWAGADVGSAGIRSYEVQYRTVGATNWSNLAVGTTATTANFNGSVGQTYQFRVRGTDKAFNRSNWQYNLKTTMYSWLISGNITDNRGNPVTDATVNTTPASFETYPSDFLGFFKNYAGSAPSVYSVNWLKSGYGSLSTTTYTVDNDALVSMTLPPADNMLSNWGFEDSWLGDAGSWQTAGLTSLFRTDASHTGTHSVLMGELSLPALENISNSPVLHSSTPKITTTADGITHIIWSEATTSNPEATIPEIRYINVTPDGTRSLPQTISVPGNASYYSILQADEEGKLHVAWLQKIGTSSYVYYAQRDESGNWSVPFNIAPVSIGYAKPKIAISSNGIVYLVWNDRENNNDLLFFSQREINGIWSAPILLAPDMVSLGSFVMEMDSSDGLHVVWNEIADPNIFAVYLPNGGSWTAPTPVSEDLGFKGAPALSIDGSGKPHIVWTNDNNDSVYRVYYASRNMDGTWTTPLKISGTGASISGVRVAATEDAKLHIMWQEVEGTRYVFRNSNGNWGGIQTVQSILALPTFFQVDRSGVLHVGWHEYSQNSYTSRLYYTNRSTNDVWEIPTLIASVTDFSSSFSGFNISLGNNDSLSFVWSLLTEIWDLDGEVFFRHTKGGTYTIFQNHQMMPLSMTNPTLSFFVKPTPGNNTDKLNLNVTVTNGVVSQTFPVTGLKTEMWSHHWFDLSQWQNEEMEISINYETSSATALQGVYLDEISLGSAFTDIKVQVEGPREALQGEEIVLTVTYENGSSIDAEGSILTAVLPPQLTFLNASLPPSSQSPTLTWNIGDLPANSGPQSFTITARVKNSAQGLSNAVSTVNISTSSTELEVLNNVGESELLVGTRLYVPLIMRN